MFTQTPRVERLDYVAHVKRQLRTLIEDFLASRRDELRPIDLAYAAQTVVVVIESLAQAELLEAPARLSEPGTAERIAEVVLRYLVD